MEDDDIDQTELVGQATTEDYDIVVNQAVSPSEVLQVVPSNFVAMAGNFDSPSDTILDLNNVVMSNNLVVDQNYEISGNLTAQGDIILVHSAEVVQENREFSCSNKNSDKVSKKDSTLNCDDDDLSRDSFQNLVINTNSNSKQWNGKSSKFGIECPECGSPLKNMTIFRKHIRIFHSKSTKKERKTQNEAPQADPCVAESEDRTYCCPACSYTTGRRDKMDKHVRKHVDDGYHPSGKKRNCPNQPLQRQHHNAEEYHCEFCSYVCTVEEALIKHQKVHYTTKEFIMKVSCKICGKDRQNDNELKKHMRKHIDGNNFICDLCGFSSVQLKKIIQHRRMHTGERPHLCPFCCYRSARRDNLRSHVRRMHKKGNMYIDTFSPMDLTVEVSNSP